MENNRVTAVKWLIEQISYDNGHGIIRNSFDEMTDLSEFIEQAKAMEKEQMIDAFMGYETYSSENLELAEQYYNETYGQN